MILVEMPETPGPLDEDRFDISSSIVNINRNLYVGGDTTIGGQLTIIGDTTVNDFNINGDLSVNFLKNHTLRVPSTFTIDPSGHGDGDITGKVIILKSQ